MSISDIGDLPKKTYLEVAKNAVVPRRSPFRVPREIYLEIAKQCTVSTLKKLCRTCKEVYALLIHLLYEYINLSLHHPADETQITSSLTERIYLAESSFLRNHHSPEETIPNLGDSFLKYPLIVRKRKQQDICLQAMTIKPELAKYVKSFRWTFLTYGENVKGISLPGNDRQYRLWYVINLMTSVRHVDLSHGPLHEIENFADTLPTGSPLFPSAKSIRLAGIMDCRLASAVLHHAILGNVEHLCLDHLMEASASPTATYNRRPDGFVPMALLFARLTGRCTALKSFTWRRQWQVANCTSFDRTRFLDENDSAGLEFLQSLYPTFQTLIIDQQQPRMLVDIAEATGQEVHYLTPVDGAWPCLKGLFVNCWSVVNRLTPPEPLPASRVEILIKQLKESLGPGVQIIVSLKLPPAPWDYSSRTFHTRYEERLNLISG